MADQEVTTKFKVDISDLKKNITEANREMKLANAQFKASASAMDDWGSSADGVSAKIKQINKVIDAQKSKISAYKSQLARVQEAYEENGRRAEELRTKMAQLIDDGVDPASDEYKQYQRSLQEVTKEQDANKKAADDLQVTILNQTAALNTSERELRTYETTLTELEQAEQQAADGAKDQKSAYESLESTVKEQQQALDQLKQTYADAVVQYGKNSTEAKQFESSIKELSSELSTNKQKLSDADKAADDLDKSMDDAGDAVDKAKEGFTVFKGVLANLVADGIRMAVDGLRDLGQAVYDAYQQYDEGADIIIKATGATGQAAEDLQKSYKNVTKSVVGDFDQIGATLGELNTRFGFTGEQLEEATIQFTKFADITGTDAKTAVQLVSRAMGDAGIEADQYSDVLDALTAASQASGISIDTLAGNLTKYGAPMRALGFDTQEAIAVFAGWEKAGVNTEIAFSGMKKAISNWAKEGKDSRKEFKKTLEEIEKCPDIASATTKAIEVFGAKAGPDLADAIKEGRFEYSDFLDILEDSKGTVTKTYEATQDGFDKVKLAIQGGKAEIGAYVSELADKYAPQIEQFATDVVAELKKVIKWSAENIKTIGAFAAALAGAFVTAQILTFINTIAQTVTVINGLVTAMTAAETATKLLSAAQAATPWGLVALALGGLTAAMIEYKKRQDEAIQAEYGLTEAQKQSVSEAQEAKKAYDDLSAARQESLDGISAEYGYLGELKDEYNSLIDSNGQVKEGYEDRANFILNELANALGVEREEIEQNIDANGRFGQSIDDLILKKQAEASLSAGQDAYTTAIKERDKSLKTYQKSLKTLNAAEKTYTDSIKENGDVLTEYEGMLKTAPSTADDFYWANHKIIEGQKEAKKAYEEAKQGVEDSESAYVGYISTISNYEGLSSAIISGDVDKINAALLDMQTGFITAENGTRESLQRQLANAQENYASLKQAAQEGMAGVTQETVQQAADLVTKSKAELDKLPPAAATTFDDLIIMCKNNGIHIPKSVADGISSGAYEVPQSVEAMERLISFDTLLRNAGLSGAAVPDEIEAAVLAGEMKPKEAVDMMTANATANALTTSQQGGQAIGEALPQGTAEGIAASQGIANAAAAQSATDTTNAAKEAAGVNSPSAVWRDEIGLMLGQGLADGITLSVPIVQAAATALLQGAFTDSSGIVARMKALGSSAASTFASGISAGRGAVTKAGTALKNALAKAATGTLDALGRKVGASYAAGVTATQGSSSLAGSLLKTAVTKGATVSLLSLGKTVGGTYSTGVRSTQPAATAAGTALRDAVKKAVSVSLRAEGQKAGQGYADGVSDKKGAAKSAGESLKNNAVDGSKGGYNGFYTAGANAAEGFRDGIKSKAAAAAREARSMVRNAINAAKNEQESASPAKVWIHEVGEMSGEGYIVGIANKIRPAMKEAQSLVRDSIQAASKEARSNVIDFGDFGQTLRSSMAMAAGSVYAPAGANGAYGQGQAQSPVTNITYNQTINSPKAPSRIELYRQTRNLLEFVEGGAV